MGISEILERNTKIEDKILDKIVLANTIKIYKKN